MNSYSSFQSLKKVMQNQVCKGHCQKCGTIHSLQSTQALTPCLELMSSLRKTKNIALSSEVNSQSTDWSTDLLFGKARGQMFGVLTYINTHGKKKKVYAFSGQYNGQWFVPGWVPPLFDVERFHTINTPAEKEIKQLGKFIEVEKSLSTKEFLLKKRKKLSQKLMKEIHALYRLTNFRGHTVSLAELLGDRPLPSGFGDCCAPKLLNYAACNNLKPTGLAEFFWGQENRSHTRRHGQFYGPCADKCTPILGFLLCGLC